MDTVRCEGINKNGKQCKLNAVTDSEFCKKHKKDEDSKLWKYDGKCITITFSDVVENGVGMEKIGNNSKKLGEKFTPEYLKELSNKYVDSEIVDLRLRTKYIPEGLTRNDVDEACILVIRNFCDLINESDNSIENDSSVKSDSSAVESDTCLADNILNELLSKTWDSKAIFRGQVKNKNARHNLCFADRSQKPKYEEGKGTIVNFKNLPHLSKAREKLNDLLPSPFTLYAEGNLYYDISKTYIGLHGDTERNVVIGLRLGDQIPLHYDVN